MVQYLVSASCHVRLSSVEVGNAGREDRGWRSEMSSCFMKKNLELSAGIPSFLTKC